MSHDESLYAFDERLFDPLVRHHRTVAALATDDKPPNIPVDHPATRAFHALVDGITVPASPVRARARAQLASLASIDAPEVFLAFTRARADPKQAVLQALDAGTLPSLAITLDLAARAEMPLHEPFRQLCWLADPRRRDVLETFTDWPFVRTAPPDPAIDELLFGTSPFTLDGQSIDAFEYPYTTDRRCRWHRVADLPRVLAFLQGLLQHAPPPLEAYRRGYPGVHASAFAVATDPTVPTGGALDWDYARFLAGQHAFVTRLARFLGHALRRRRAVVVYIE